MKFLITFEMFNTITNSEDVNHLREAVGKQLQHMQSSGKMVDGAMFGDQRGGYFVFDVDKALDLYDLLGGTLFDACNIESHPLLSFEELGNFSRKIQLANDKQNGIKH